MFTVLEEDRESRARRGILHLNHGDVATPVFMPVGTNAAVKAVSHRDLEEIGFNLILGNTYHVYLRPGLEVIRGYGGLHRFSGWRGNILTDSGGFQIFSLAPLRKIRQEGVSFRSHIDGASCVFTPRSVVEAQSVFGSDIMMPLDVCTPPGISRGEAEEALAITGAWAERSKEAWLGLSEEGRGELFGIIQGNFFEDLRRRGVEEILGLDLPGIAIGGLSVGESPQRFSELLAFTSALLPREKPRYVMGIGTPRYILEAVENGIDMFDCVFPTRIARNGCLFTNRGRLVLKREENRGLDRPPDEECSCPVCGRYSIGYLRHLFKTNEILGPMLATYHNLYYMKNFIEKISCSIKNHTFLQFKKEFLETYGTAGS
ncbi:MAG: tRNA guanosine(34) transglycosylase Tgt [Spirochaetales bacterium]|jgi:queuine tRNA-ribosyltransferase|nr:tRNA guanosine(34) transglycosylase Tgt [Spirochaetales bacterium]